MPEILVPPPVVALLGSMGDRGPGHGLAHQSHDLPLRNHFHLCGFCFHAEDNIMET